MRIVTGTVTTGGSVAFSTAFASQSVSGTLSSTTATNQNTTAGGSVSLSAGGSVNLSGGGSVSAASLSTAQLASHQHYAEGNVGPVFGTVVGGNQLRGAYNGYQTVTTQPVQQATGSGSTHNHGFTNPTYSLSNPSYSFSGTAHTHTQDAHTHTFTGTAINLAVKYIDFIIATKD